ncbi:MAG: DUF3159 domain-containing protein [Tetrasphaera jenkinsii]|uniref:Integral membrane protein n=1 Tax=Nostocoides jenkinsii Ben 74 TaxID=1193518 RepID=A0A077MDV3_9MICO|nr:DUF3159 domain-containing protein [Tetrasphaera jenkinsii]MCI1261392.1 DUF3159 domain-containing protein [Tetrasphaera jenkinsii]CCI52983.1 conserved membrane hypothetical protein [Tetrasphaera jenkinsii Ben 74]
MSTAPIHGTETVEEIIRHRLSQAVGGWRGSLETALPTIAFVAGWTLTKEVRPSLIAAGVAAVILAGLRLAQRQSLQYVLSAVFATAIAAFFALRSGKAEDAFLPGIMINAVYAVGTLVSVLTRYPLIGFLVGAGDPEAKTDPLRWRRDPSMVQVCGRLTLVMVAMFAIRVAVMYPLYLAGNIAALGAAKIALGWPLWAAAIAVMGAMLMRGATPHTPSRA